MARELLNAADFDRLTATIGRAEAATAGEIALVVSQRSDAYVLERLRWVLPIAALGCLGTQALWPAMSGFWVTFTSIAVGINLYLLSGLGPCLRRLVPTSAIATQVHLACLRFFTERAVYRTRDQSGILLYVSEAEHRIEVLADEGITSRVAPDLWQAHVTELAQALRQGQAADGLCREIEALGELLATHFPADATNPNELDNRPHRA